MRRRELLTAVGAAALTAAAGCQSLADDGSTPSNTPDGDVTITPGPGDTRIVVVSQSGEVTGDPDLAVLNVAIEVTGDTASTVRADLAERSDDVVTALRDYGLGEDDITTRDYRIDERIDRRAMEADGVRPGADVDLDEYRYYVGRHSLAVELDEIDDAGAVVDVAVEAGATRVDNVTYTLSDEKRRELRETAIQRALRNARAEADTIAAEVDGRIIEATVVDAAEGDFHPVTRDVAYARGTPAPEMTPAPRTRLEPGDVTVTARVRVKYTME